MAGKEQLIEAVLCSLAEKKQVRIKRMAGDNSPIRSVSMAKSSPGHKPVQPTLVAASSAPSQVEMKEDLVVTTRPTEPLHVRLTTALVALQVNATEGGDVKANSLAELLMKELGLTTDQARLLLRQLDELGLKRSKNLGGGKYSHQVRTDVQEVTEAMVTELKANKSETPAPAQTEPVVPDEDVFSGLLSIVEQLEAAPPPELAQDDDVVELLSIVEQLEAKLVEASDSLSQAMEVISTLRAENASLAAEVSRSQGQVAELTAQVQLKVAQRAKASEVIARYRSKS